MADIDEQIHWGWAKNPSSYMANMWTKYKLNMEGFNRLWGGQNGRCVGCDKELSHPTWREARMGLKPEVDHDHKTGKVRGLLCRRCNGFMGKLLDNKDTFRRLADYLEKHHEI